MTSVNPSAKATYVVLGATGAVGEDVARRLASRGRPLFLAGRNPDRLRALRQELDADGALIDASRPAEIEAAIANAGEHGVAGVVNCIGSVLLKPAHLTTWDEWNETIEVNLTTAFAAVRGAAKTMMRTGGSIVLVSTAAARIGLANHEAIAAAKAGVVGLARAAAASYGSRGIRINVVAPGLVRSRASERITSNPDALKASTGMHVLRRIGEPSDVGSMIEWLLDPANSWVTGQEFGVDGGLGTVRSRT